jgi:hypothetical protein
VTDRKPTIDGVRARRGRWLTLLALTGLVVGIAIIITAAATQRHAAQPAPGAWGTVASRTPTTPLPGPATSTMPSPAGTAKPAGKADPSNGPSTPAKTSSPADPASSTGTSHKPDKQAATSSDDSHHPTALPSSEPIKIDIPAITVDSTVFGIGKDSHGGLQVPQPGPHLNDVAWYDGSPTPGQTGPAVLEGHVDTIHGPSVFLRLGALSPGDKIKIGRADGTTAVFTVNAVRDYKSHSSFPSDLVYGGDLSSPTLRIITCSNFDQGIGHYVGNTIVFAHLTAVHH